MGDFVMGDFEVNSMTKSPEDIIPLDNIPSTLNKFVRALVFCDFLRKVRLGGWCTAPSLGQ